MHPIVGRMEENVNPRMGCAPKKAIGYPVSGMANGLRTARTKAKMNLDEAARRLGLSKSGYTKKERSERRLSDDFIRRACELFGVSAEDIIGETGGIAFTQDIDPNKLAALVMLARERLGALPEIEAKNLILALISASRRPLGPGEDRQN